MNFYIFLPFIVLKTKIDGKQDRYLSVLTDDYAEKFADVKYVYPANSEIIGKKAHCKGSVGWMYTKMLPETFKLYEGGQT